MNQVKKYELSRRHFVCIRDQHKRAYGGNQEWFSKEHSIREKIIHEYGCGVIAITDLFLYWAMTLPNGKDTLAARYIEEYDIITKENYMALVEEIRKRYAFIFGSAGTFGPQLEMAINRYAKENHINYKASLEMNLNDLTMLKRMQAMLEANQPIILMIGHSFPIVLSRLRKKGIPFYKQTRIIHSESKKQNQPYAHYEVAKRSIFGHFVTVTGMIIDEHASLASQDIMLRISSWGVEYYISYHHLRQYINGVSTPYLSAMMCIMEHTVSQ